MSVAPSAVAPPAPVQDHGGNLSEARRMFPGAPEPWLDLSTGINPWPYPFTPPPPEAWQRLPDELELQSLMVAATLAYGAPAPDRVVAAPGSQALIQMLPRLRPPGRVAVLAPTYAEHAAAWSAAGHAVSLVESPLTLAAAPWDTAVVVNPNNPDGRALEPGVLQTLLRTFKSREGWLVVDEAFAEVAPEISMAALSDTPGLIVLRSFGKFFGLAGARLGFALAAPETAARIRAAFGPWAISGPARAVAVQALNDAAWISDTRQHLSQAAAQLDRLLAERELRVIGGTSLYRLVDAGSADRAATLFRALGGAGILVRRFFSHPRWLRFGLPPDEVASRRLSAALEQGDRAR